MHMPGAVLCLAEVVACPPSIPAQVGYPHGPLNAGNSEMRTPNLDRLAMEGIRLERHCASQLVSRPLALSRVARKMMVRAPNGSLACSKLDGNLSTE